MLRDRRSRHLDMRRELSHARRAFRKELEHGETRWVGKRGKSTSCRDLD
jgi:hypothetical protein